MTRTETSPRFEKSLQQLLGSEYRRQLLLLNRERIELAYVKARANGIDGPVILILDLQDEGAAQLAHQTGLPWDTIEQCRNECEQCGVVPAQVISAPNWAITCLIDNGKTDIPTGTFRVVAIAAGGNSVTDFLLPPESCLGPE